MMYDRWVRFLMFFDLTSAGSPSFSKFICLAILLAAIQQGQLTLGIIIALLAASFGRSVFLAFLKRSSVSAVEVQATTRQEIIERRDVEAGVEPSP